MNTRIHIKKQSLSSILFFYCIFYICFYYLLDIKVGRVPKYFFFFCILYGTFRYFYILLIKNRARLETLSKLSFALYILVLLTFLFLCLSVDNRDLMLRGLYEYVFYFLFFPCTSYYSERVDNAAVFRTLSYIGVVLSICAVYEQLSRRYIIGMATHSYWVDSATVNNTSQGAIRAVVFSGSFLAFGMLMAVISVVSFYLYSIEKKRHQLLIFFINFIGLLMSMSRGPWISALLALIMIYLYSYDGNGLKPRARKVLGLIVIMIALLFSIYVLSRYYTYAEALWDRIISSFQWSRGDVSNNNRVDRWREGFEVFTDNWVIGTGPASTGSRVSLITESGILKRLVECGVFATILYYAFLLDFIFVGIRHSINVKNVYMMVAIGVSFAILFEDIFLQITEEVNVYFLMAYYINLLYVNHPSNLISDSSGNRSLN